MNYNGEMRLKRKLKIIYIISPPVILFYFILFLIAKGIMHYLLLSITIGLFVLAILSYLDTTRAIKNKKGNIKFISKKQLYIYYISIICTLLIVLILYFVIL